MTDRSINLGCVVAYALWAAMVMFIALGMFLHNPHVGHVGLAAAAAAATASIRCYFVRSNQIMRNTMAFREDGGSSIRSVPLKQ